MEAGGSSRSECSEKGRAATLDEAMSIAGCGIFNVGILLLSGLILMGMIMETLGLSYIIPAAQCDLNLSLFDKGWLAAIPFVGIIVTSHMWGWAADTQGRRPVMLLSMTVASIFSCLSSFAPNLWSFGLLRFIAAVFISGPSAVCYAYLGELNSIQHRDKMVAFGASFVGIGTVVLPAISWLILPTEFEFSIEILDITYRPWRLLVVVCALPYAICALAMLAAPESPKFLHAVGKSQDALEVVKRIYVWNSRQLPSSFPVVMVTSESTRTTGEDKGFWAVMKSMRDQTFPLFKSPLLFYTCISCFVQFGIFASSNGFYVWFPTILNHLSNHIAAGNSPSVTICQVLAPVAEAAANATVACDDTVNAGTYYKAIMMGLVFCTAYIVAGVVVDCIGKKNILIGVLFFSGACGIATVWVPEQTAAIVLFGVFQMCGSCIGMMTAVVVDLYPTHLRAMAVCLSLMMGRVGSVLGSNVIGQLINHHCPSSFIIFGGLLVLCSLFCILLPDMKRTNSPPEAESTV